MEKKYLKENNGFIGRNSINGFQEQSSPYYYYSKSSQNGITASATNSTDGLILLDSSRGQTSEFIGQEQKQQQHNGQSECVVKDKHSKKTYTNTLYDKSGERHSESYQNNFGMETTTGLYPSWISNTAARENQKITQIQKIYNNSIIQRSRLNQNAHPNNVNNPTGHNQHKNKSPMQFFNNQSNHIQNTTSQQGQIIQVSPFTDNAESQKYLRTQLSQILPQSPHKNCNQPLRKYYSSQHMSQGIRQQQLIQQQEGSNAGQFTKEDCSSLKNQSYRSNCSSVSVLNQEQTNESEVIYFKQKDNNNNDFQKVILTKSIRQKEMNLDNQGTVYKKQTLESTFEQFKILPQPQMSALILPPPPQKRLVLAGAVDSSRRAIDKHKNSAGFLGQSSQTSKFYSTEPHFNKQILKKLQGSSKLSGKPQLSPISQSKIISSDQSRNGLFTGQPSRKLKPTDIEKNNINNKSVKQPEQQESKDCLKQSGKTQSQLQQEEHDGNHMIKEREEHNTKLQQQINCQNLQNDQNNLHSRHASSEEQVKEQTNIQNKLNKEQEIDVKNTSNQNNQSKGEEKQGEEYDLRRKHQYNQFEIIEQETKEMPAELWEQVRAISEARPYTSGAGKRRLKINKQIDQKLVRSNQEIKESENYESQENQEKDKELKDQCRLSRQQKLNDREISFEEQQQSKLDLLTIKQSGNNHKVDMRQLEDTEEEYANCSGEFEEDLNENNEQGKMKKQQKQKKNDASCKFSMTHQGVFFGKNKLGSENMPNDLSKISSEQRQQEKLFNLHKKTTKVTQIESENTQDQQILPHKIIIRHNKTAASTTRVQKQNNSQQDDVIQREVVKFETGLDSEFIQLFASQKIL